MSRYMNGLNDNICDEMDCNPIFTLSVAQNLAIKVEMKIATKKNSRSSVLHLHLKGPIEPLDKGYLWPTLESQRGRYRANKRPVAETKAVPKCQPINLVLSQRNNQPNNPYAKSRG